MNIQTWGTCFDDRFIFTSPLDGSTTAGGSGLSLPAFRSQYWAWSSDFIKSYYKSVLRILVHRQFGCNLQMVRIKVLKLKDNNNKILQMISDYYFLIWYCVDYKLRADDQAPIHRVQKIKTQNYQALNHIEGWTTTYDVNSHEHCRQQ